MYCEYSPHFLLLHMLGREPLLSIDCVPPKDTCHFVICVLLASGTRGFRLVGGKKIESLKPQTTGEQ
jgi:hypothetical protein